ncbi:DNA-directed RNA polymerase II subunit RPB1-like [Portunus trituberculatus]|uniref:DNA-directed RNA polymerase II subunit RPB1-like n=1 Tax=Portunus trituberculatus TaxID=210409 RepID=UPI001E1D1F95|nr:DNA-directed RNA polymerase II subunit RPB1-like [Portunus trituberculatus]
MGVFSRPDRCLHPVTPTGSQIRGYEIQGYLQTRNKEQLSYTPTHPIDTPNTPFSPPLHPLTPSAPPTRPYERPNSQYSRPAVCLVPNVPLLTPNLPYHSLHPVVCGLKVRKALPSRTPDSRHRMRNSMESFSPPPTTPHVSWLTTPPLSSPPSRSPHPCP